MRARAPAPHGLPRVWVETPVPPVFGKETAAGILGARLFFPSQVKSRFLDSAEPFASEQSHFARNDSAVGAKG
jgi:hypothetical protein